MNKNQHGRIIAILRDNKIFYHYVQNEQQERDLMGITLGRFTTAEYLQNEKNIQELMKKTYEKKI